MLFGLHIEMMTMLNQTPVPRSIPQIFGSRYDGGAEVSAKAAGTARG